MRFILVFQFFIAVLVLNSGAGFATSARDYIWGPPQKDFVRPFLEEAKLPHNARWADDEWSPKDWIDSRGGSVKAVVDGLYRADIVADQYVDNDIPVLEVGQGFLELGAQDKRRVIAFMDEVFGVTKFSTPGVILIVFHQDKSWLHDLLEDNDERIGFFDANGLQLQ
ncbi:MAG: hypothetical protein H6861_09490 [Rhodospirillales bacterium]|nr:hypothetical protein [Rhodospirillales bacterium]